MLVPKPDGLMQFMHCTQGQEVLDCKGFTCMGADRGPRTLPHACKSEIEPTTCGFWRL